MDDRITILDGGRTLSLRFGDQAHEIVADSPNEAVEVLAKMLFAEHARAETLATFVQLVCKVMPTNSHIVREAHAALADHEPSREDSG